MLKTTTPSERSIFERLEVDNGEFDRFGVMSNNMEYAKKSRKLSKLEKLSKSRKLAKLGKKLSKIVNLFNLNTKKTGPSFLTSSTRETFNRLWLAFTEALIF